MFFGFARVVVIPKAQCFADKLSILRTTSCILVTLETAGRKLLFIVYSKCCKKSSQVYANLIKDFHSARIDFVQT